jgi:PEP-CTERM motif
MFRPKILLALAAALALTVGARSASADVFNLNIDHSSGSPVTVSPPFGTVTLTLVSSTEVTIAYVANTSQITGFHEVGFNFVSAGGSTITSVTPTVIGGTITFSPEGTSIMDGLGTFTNVYGRTNAGPPSNQAQSVTLDIMGTNLALSQFENLSSGGDPSVDFAAGFSRMNGTITGWVGSSPSVVVPEPSTMAIAGLGALGLIGYGLRRRKALGA